jgi:hypothetical protein
MKHILENIIYCTTYIVCNNAPSVDSDIEPALQSFQVGSLDRVFVIVLANEC